MKYSVYPYTLKFTKRLLDYDCSVEEELGFTSIASARRWVKKVNEKPQVNFEVTDFIVRRTVVWMNITKFVFIHQNIILDR